MSGNSDSSTSSVSAEVSTSSVSSGVEGQRPASPWLPLQQTFSSLAPVSGEEEKEKKTTSRLIIHPGNLAGDPIHLDSAMILDPRMHLCIVSTSQVVDVLENCISTSKEDIDKGISEFKTRAKSALEAWAEPLGQVGKEFEDLNREFDVLQVEHKRLEGIDHKGQGKEAIKKEKETNIKTLIGNIEQFGNKIVQFNAKTTSVRSLAAQPLSEMQEEKKDESVQQQPVLLKKKAKGEKGGGPLLKSIQEAKSLENGVQKKFFDSGNLNEPLKKCDGFLKIFETELGVSRINLESCQFGKACWHEMVVLINLLHKSKQLDGQLGKRVHILGGLEKKPQGAGMYKDAVEVTEGFLFPDVASKSKPSILADAKYFTGDYRIGVTASSTSAIVSQNPQLALRVLNGQLAPLSVSDREKLVDKEVKNKDKEAVQTDKPEEEKNKIKQLITQKCFPERKAGEKELDEEKVKTGYQVILVMVRDAIENRQHNTSVTLVTDILQAVEAHNAQIKKTETEGVKGKDAPKPYRVLLLTQAKASIPMAPDPSVESLKAGKRPAERKELGKLYTQEWKQYHGKDGILLGHLDIYKDLESTLGLKDYPLPADRSFVLELLREIAHHPEIFGIIGGRSGSLDSVSFAGGELPGPSGFCSLCFDLFYRGNLIDKDNLRLLLTHTFMTTTFLEEEKFKPEELKAFLEGKPMSAGHALVRAQNIKQGKDQKKVSEDDTQKIAKQPKKSEKAGDKTEVPIEASIQPEAKNIETLLKEGDYKVAPQLKFEEVKIGDKQQEPKKTKDSPLSSLKTSTNIPLLLYENFTEYSDFFETSSPSIEINTPAGQRYIALVEEQSTTERLYYEYFQVLAQEANIMNEFPQVVPLNMGICHPDVINKNASYLLEHAPSSEIKSTEEVQNTKELAILSLQKAANGGFALAQYEYGMHLLNNQDENGYNYLKEAAKQGWKDAIKILPIIEFESAKLTPKMLESTLSCLREAARDGIAFAQNEYGNYLLKNGANTQGDMYLEMARKQGWKTSTEGTPQVSSTIENIGYELKDVDTSKIQTTPMEPTIPKTTIMPRPEETKVVSLSWMQASGQNKSSLTLLKELIEEIERLPVIKGEQPITKEEQAILDMLDKIITSVQGNQIQPK